MIKDISGKILIKDFARSSAHGAVISQRSFWPVINTCPIMLYKSASVTFYSINDRQSGFEIVYAFHRNADEDVGLVDVQTEVTLVKDALFFAMVIDYSVVYDFCTALSCFFKKLRLFLAVPYQMKNDRCTFFAHVYYITDAVYIYQMIYGT